jgi:glycosyltransferase involved in cell wall biosynthesis
LATGLEVLRDGENGFAVDFFSPRMLANRIAAALEHPARMQPLRDAARATAVERFDLKSVLLPRWLTLVDDLIHHRPHDARLRNLHPHFIGPMPATGYA